MDPSNNTETEDETIAFKKKRARRVSFADNEITSVHIFRRDDEDSESPLESTKPFSPTDGKSPENEVLGFFRDLAGDSDEEDLKELSTPRNSGGNGNDNDDDGESVNVRKSFLKPIGSPSPGSSTVGSVASTDNEDEFHGPVSASFIRPGELSDSAASHDNHDLTMDSTAFSLHYRSLACSDTGDLKTPTRFAVPFEEKTPSQTSGPTASGSFMELTKVTRLSPQPLVPADTSCVSKDSNDMSIVGENPRRFDYDRLSPSIESILAEGSKDLLVAPKLDSNGSGLSKPSKASPIRKNNNGVRSQSDSAINDAPKHEMSLPPRKLDEINISFKSSPINEITSILLFDEGDNTVADASINKIQSSDCTINGTRESVKEAVGPAKKQLGFTGASMKSLPEVDDCLEVSAKHDLGYHYLNENQVKEINLKEAMHLSDIDHNQVDENPIQGSTPSTFSGREPLLMVSPDSSRPAGANTPSLNLPGTLLLGKYVRNGETPSSIRKSISKLKNPGTSGTSSLREGIDRSKRRLSKYSMGSTPVNLKDNEHKYIGNLNTHLENQLIIVTPENIGQQNLAKMDVHGAESLMNLGKFSQNEETVFSRKAGELYCCSTADISHDNKNPKPVEMAASPSYMLHSTAKKINFDLADGTVETIKDENVVYMHKKCSSPLELLDQWSSPSLESQKNCFSKFKQLDQQNASACSGSGHFDEGSSLATAAKHMDMPISTNNESSAFEVADVVPFSKAMYRNNSAECLAEKAQVLSANTEGVKQSPIHEASILLPLVEGLPSESPHHNSDGSNVSCHQVLQTRVADSPSNEFCVENHSGKKRKETKLLREDNTVDKMRRIDGTSQVHANENMDLQIILHQSDDIRSDREKLGKQTLKNHVNILGKFSGSTTYLLGPSSNKLNLKMIGMLEDVLVHLWRVKKFEILCAEIHSQQKITEPLSILSHRKVMETRMVLYSIAYEKAKLQLMHMKREILQKRVQQLTSALQECQKLKPTCASFSSKISNNAPSKSLILSSLVSSEGKCQAISLELEALVHEAKSLTKFLHSCCKLEYDQNSADSITLFHDYLKKRMSYKLISRNLQLWEIENLEHRDACYEIVLNYCGCIIQRLLVLTDSSTIIISNKLNDQNILKSFPNMDAFAAFVFVLNPDTTKKCNGSRCLVRETQMTSSLLCNLLDVIEEVQLARIEIRNLVQVKFYSQSVDQLELLLSFVDFSTGRKFKVVFDMACLKCSGVYPMEILPSHISYVADVEQKSLSRSLEVDIRTATERVTVGYSRLMKLCRSISQVVMTLGSST
ncbi:uncharacterized protein LOC129318494 isoform X3 [Prosopis cineraria]|uniref:uncharacterized protein LOC129318494 isoform X3 n=1 Tax=Prosopis cineraria TaxID=364024 RepID=UPI00240FF088|nr:uncharacterized protein LOC129318494 isoform X3 [Prosopis cineraria]